MKKKQSGKWSSDFIRFPWSRINLNVSTKKYAFVLHFLGM